MKDRLIAGSLAGIIAGLIQYAYGLSALSLGLTDRFFGQFSDIVFAGRLHSGVLGFILSILTHLAVTIILGVIFSYIISKTSSNYYILKSAGYGFVLWFILHSFGNILRLQLFENIPAQPAIVMLVGAIIFSLSLGYALRIIEYKSNLL